MIEIRVQKAFRYCWQENTSIVNLYESQSNYSQYIFSGSVILVVGGRDDRRNYQNDSQLSSLTRSCSNLQNYPIAMRHATGAIVSGHPIICGGESWESYHSECYHHNKASNSWTFLTNMSTFRSFSASVTVNGMLLVMGGWFDRSLKTTEYISPDGDASQPGPDLPTPRDEHCAVKLSNGQVMLLGGYSDETKKSTIIFHPDKETFNQSLPSMTHERRRAGCAVFNSPMHENREVVLAVGGYQESTAEVLDYSQPNAKWNESNYV